jgi:hypothetical protein
MPRQSPGRQQQAEDADAGAAAWLNESKKHRPGSDHTLTRTPAMDDGPVVFKRTKAKGTQRTSSRANRPEDDFKVANELEEPTESPSTLASKLKKKARVKPQSRLSFGGEDEVRVCISVSGPLLMGRNMREGRSSR